jgi:dTDP-4-amino-4,6-dideoxygalactose transaminase
LTISKKEDKCVAFLRGVTDRQGLKKELKENCGVSLSGEVYELPCHLQPILKDHPAVKSGKFPVSERLCSRPYVLTLESHVERRDDRDVIAELCFSRGTGRQPV